MSCKHAKSQIALAAGNDLAAEHLPALREHVRACPCCQDLERRMAASLQLLQECRLQDDDVRRPSVWGRVAGRLPRLQAERTRPAFNGWVPASALAAAAVLMVVWTSSPWSSGVSPSAGWSLPSVNTSPDEGRDLFLSHPDFGATYDPLTEQQLMIERLRSRQDDPVVNAAFGERALPPRYELRNDWP